MEPNLWRDGFVVAAAVVPIAFALGIIVGYIAFSVGRRVPRKLAPPDREITAQVKRTRLSMRNPMRPYATKYDDFRTSRGLYQAVRPSSGGDDKEV